MDDSSQKMKEDRLDSDPDMIRKRPVRKSGFDDLASDGEGSDGINDFWKQFEHNHDPYEGMTPKERAEAIA